MSRENYLKPWRRFDKVVTLQKRSPRHRDKNDPDLNEINEQQEASEATNLIPQSRFIRSYQRVPKDETNADVTVNIRSEQAPRDEL